MIASKKSKRVTMQRTVAREYFVKCAMENIQLHSMAMSEIKLTILNTSEASEERKDGEVAACASLYTGMEVISMFVVSVKL